MDQLSTLFELLSQHPALGAGTAFALAVGYYLLQRKPRMVREADRQLEELQKKRGGEYNKLRPPT